VKTGWAYAGFVVVSLLYFPAHVGFRLHPQACELAPSLQLAIFSLQNTPHILIFGAFYVLSWIQFRRAGRAAFAWAGLATLVMGALVEIAEGVSGQGHCRLRDLVPDAAGALLAFLLIALGTSYVARRARG
jgi:VanZ family protein